MRVALCSLSCQWVITEPSSLGWLQSASPKRLLRLLILGSSIKIPEPVLKGGKSAGFPGVSEAAAFMSSQVFLLLFQMFPRKDGALEQPLYFSKYPGLAVF